ncbi:hypothetical protein RchiOBHm_Chr2g0113281 [Rosa chinensis]|uniref:Uncharacterized protein n=1 Tax=Rosa chinensis TaxID=74649 RepID=A0A2P6RQF5_ROSCH|nr:hypothetical protein RchiOBHm_Chr2g0113281 [Rosa chinensis]
MGFNYRWVEIWGYLRSLKKTAFFKSEIQRRLFVMAVLINCD